ncbi:hypothetical protein HD554DRAFT_1989647, partial [Boletus coccyginus]
NLGNNRSNIYPKVRQIQNAHDFDCMDFLFEDVVEVRSRSWSAPYHSSIRSFDAQLGWQALTSVTATHPASMCGVFLHSRRSDRSNVEELERFQTGERRALWVTEIGGMVRETPLVDYI